MTTKERQELEAKIAARMAERRAAREAKVTEEAKEEKKANTSKVYDIRRTPKTVDTTTETNNEEEEEMTRRSANNMIGLRFAELVALVATSLASTMVWGPTMLLILGFIYEILHPTCIHRARPLRFIAVGLAVASGWGCVPAIAWGLLHVWRTLIPKNRQAWTEQFIKERNDQQNWSFYADNVLGLPNFFIRIEMRSKGSIVVRRLNSQNTIKSSTIIEVDVEKKSIVGGYGWLRMKLKAGASHQEVEALNEVRIGRVSDVAEFINRQSGDPTTLVEPW